MRAWRWLPAVLGAGVLAGSPAMATEFVKNGNFEMTSATVSRQMSSGSTQYVSNWTSSGYNFLVLAGKGGTVGDLQSNDYGTLSFWSTYGQGGASNGFTGTSPAGGNYLAADGAFGVSPIQQTVTGLTAGKSYTLSFWWAAAQQYGYDGATTENWTVSLGNQSYTTGTVTNPEHGFTPWKQESYSFVAGDSSAVLSFLAKGTPDGKPPFSLLDGVSLTETAAVPEPASWAMMIVGFGAIGGTLRRRRARDANVIA